MTTGDAFTKPAADRCPGCAARAEGERCARCGLLLVGVEALRLRQIDDQLHRLSVQRREALDRLRAVSATASDAVSPASGGRRPTVAVSDPAPSTTEDPEERLALPPPPDTAVSAPPGALGAAAADARPGLDRWVPPGPVRPAAAVGSPPAGTSAAPTESRPGSWGSPSGSAGSASGPWSTPGGSAGSASGPWVAPGGSAGLPPGPWGAAIPARRSKMPAVTLPHLLLGLGTALVVVAAIVFTAVRWSQLGAAVQGSVLLGLTVGTGWATGHLRRRGLSATAEALSLVTVVLLLVDVHVVRVASRGVPSLAGLGDEPLLYWCGGIGAVAAITWWFGRASGTRAPVLVAAVAAQVPVPVLVVARPVGVPGGQLLCLAQVTVTTVAVHLTPGAFRAARRAGVVGAAILWCSATLTTVGLALDGPGSHRLDDAAVLALAAAVVGSVAALRPHDDRRRPRALAAATATGLVAAGTAMSVGVTGDAWWPAAAGICAAVLIGSVRLPRRWGDPPALVAATLGVLASLPLVVSVSQALVAALAASELGWGRGAGVPVRSLREPGVALPPDGLAAVHLAVLASALVGAHRRIGARVTRAALTALGWVAVLVVPFVADLTIGATVAVTLVAASGAAAAVLLRPGASRRITPVAALAGLSVLALVWSGAAAATTLAAVGVTGALAAALVVAAVRDGAGPVAIVAAVVVVVALVAEAGLATGAVGAAPGTAWLVAGLVAAGTGLLVGAVHRAEVVVRLVVGRAAGGASPEGDPPVAGVDAGRSAPRIGLVRDLQVAVQATGVLLHLLAVIVAVGLTGPAQLSVLIAATVLLAAWHVHRAVTESVPGLAEVAAPAFTASAVAEAGLVTAALGGTAGQGWMTAGMVAAGVTLAAAATAPTGGAPSPRGLAATLVEASGATLHVVAVLAVAALEGADAASIVLAVGAATAGVHALRPGRRQAVMWAATEALVLTWNRLAVAGVTVPEAYTLPLAVALLVPALAAHRTGAARRSPSWLVHGPWLLAAIVPTVLLALGDPEPVRPLGGLVAGAVVLVVGAATRRRAPVDIGAVTVAVLGLRQLAPIVAVLPNWSTVGACGVVLLVVGATFEKRRRNLREIRDRYASLV